MKNKLLVSLQVLHVFIGVKTYLIEFQENELLYKIFLQRRYTNLKMINFNACDRKTSSNQ